jgi:hypothetical protein
MRRRTVLQKLQVQVGRQLFIDGERTRRWFASIGLAIAVGIAYFLAARLSLASACERGSQERAPRRPAFRKFTGWAQCREKLRLDDGLLQDGRCLSRRQRRNGVAGGYDDADALIVQSIDQAVRQLAASKIEIDQGHVRCLLGDQLLGLSGGCDWSGHLRSQSLEQARQGYGQVPGIFDHEDSQARQIR